MRKQLTLLLLVAITFGVALAPGIGREDSSARAAGTFKQEQRMTSFVLKTSTDAFAPNNRFGSAIVPGSVFQSTFQSTLDSSVASGDITILLRMLGLNDLSGTNEPSLTVGVVGGAPQLPASNPATYSGTSDLDWWYDQSPGAIDANGVPTAQLTGSIVSHALSVGPGRMAFEGPLGSLTFSNARIAATTGAVSTPLTSTNTFPPGHLPSEAIDPLLQSFETMSAGKLAGNIGTAALALTPIPAPLVAPAPTACLEGYSASNTFLDLLVGGCSVIVVIFQVHQVNPSQPDQSDPAAPVAGAGAPYTFTRTGTSVTGCKDHLGAVVDLTTCMNAAAYSSYFQFTSDRVIIPDPPPVAPPSVGGIAEQPDVTSLPSAAKTSDRDDVIYGIGAAIALLVGGAAFSWRMRRTRQQPRLP